MRRPKKIQVQGAMSQRDKSALSGFSFLAEGHNREVKAKDLEIFSISHPQNAVAEDLKATGYKTLQRRLCGYTCCWR
jgi:hypothetical protein